MVSSLDHGTLFYTEGFDDLFTSACHRDRRFLVPPHLVYVSDLIHALVSRKRNGVASIGIAVKMKDHVIPPMEVRNNSLKYMTRPSDEDQKIMN